MCNFNGIVTSAAASAYQPPINYSTPGTMQRPSKVSNNSTDEYLDTFGFGLRILCAVTIKFYWIFRVINIDAAEEDERIAQMREQSRKAIYVCLSTFHI